MPLTQRHHLILDLAAERGELTSAFVAQELAVTRAHANSLLRSLERRGHLRAELIEGGRLRYAPERALAAAA